MATKAVVDDSVIERRLRPIYGKEFKADLFDFKSALIKISVKSIYILQNLELNKIFGIIVYKHYLSLPLSQLTSFILISDYFELYFMSYDFIYT